MLQCLQEMEQLREQTTVMIHDYIEARMGLEGPAPNKTALRLRERGEELEAINSDSFVSMARTIQTELITLLEVQDTLRSVLQLAFQDKELNWGLMITLVSFTGVMAEECMNQGGTTADAQSLAEILTKSVMEYGGHWLLEKGHHLG